MAKTAEVVEVYEITNPELFGVELEGFSTLGRTERGKLYGDKDGKIQEVGVSAADILFRMGENSGALVKKIEADIPAEAQNQIDSLRLQLETERREHAAEIERLNQSHNSEMQELKELIEKRFRWLYDTIAANYPDSPLLKTDWADPDEIWEVEPIAEPEEPETEPNRDEWTTPAPVPEGEKTGGFVDNSETDETDHVTAARPTWRDRTQTARDWFSLRRPVTHMQTLRYPYGEVEEVEVTEERTNPVAVAAGFIGAAILGGIIGYELKHTGHSNVKEFHNIINQNEHLKTEVHNMHQTINHDSALIKENHQILKHNRAELKHLHEQVHSIYKMEKSEVVSGGHATEAEASGQAKLSYYGDTVWHETARNLKEKLGHSVSIAKIHKATAYVLRINGLRWNGGGFGVDAHRLPVGFRFRIPSDIAEIANQ